MNILDSMMSRLGLTMAVDGSPTGGGLGRSLGMFFTAAGDSGTRTSTVFMPTDSRRELTNQTRMEIVKKSRWIFNNLGLMRRLVNGVSRYAVGNGLTPIPETTDKAWNKAAAAYFDDWGSNAVLCDVQGKKSFWAMQKQAVKSLIKDGEFFAVQTAGADQPDPNDSEPDEAKKKKIPGRPQLQWLETQQVANPAGQNRDLDPNGFREGIKCNALNRAMQYQVLSDRDPIQRDLSRATPVDAINMIHVLDADRSGMTHGVPWGYSGSNSAVDIMDLNALEKAAAKLHSMVAGSINKKSADAGIRGFSGGLRKNKSVGADGKQKTIAFEEFLGGAAILQLATDEEFKLLKSDRPAATWIGFIDYLVRDIAYGFGVSPEFIWNVAGMGGANTRFILQDSQWFFEEIQQLLIDSFCQRVYAWVIARAMKRGELPECADVRWWNCRWQPPAKVTVDAGQQGELDIALIKNGLSNWENYYASRGMEAGAAIDQRIEELRVTMEKCKAANVPFSLIFQLDPGSPGATALNAAAGLMPDGSPPPAPEDDGDDDGVQAEMENYSEGVKVGVLTPNADDENYFRKKLGLPLLSGKALDDWKTDPTRRPITLFPATPPEPPPGAVPPHGAKPPIVAAPVSQPPVKK